MFRMSLVGAGQTSSVRAGHAALAASSAAVTSAAIGAAGFASSTAAAAAASAATAATSDRLTYFDKILIANRGEIACRVMETASALGIRTVGVFSEADARAKHVELADEAVCVGPAPSVESYLNKEAIIEAALATGAQAIHPGYGFLSENAEFAELCERNGIVFIGPPSSAIVSMGSKSESKDIMSQSGVPLVPGYHGDDQDPDLIAAEADKIGYPVMLKAVMGGGGRGMRIVHQAKDIKDAIETTKRESAAAFGDDRLLVERYIQRPRHIEVQVFADTHGNVVHFYERDCSVQRRHQKVIEEAPAPGMDPAWREAMTTAAVNAAKAVGYVGAGTVEFIVDADTKDFFFMEMNTRLQVEHPVTELIVGQDLVRLQLAVAAGNKLPVAQEDISAKGHAMEARVYAEDPENGFLPVTGRLVHINTPSGEGVRVDTGVREGDEISVYYDAMISKLIVYGEDRADAIAKLSKALDSYDVVGLTTNIPFCKRILRQPAFVAFDDLTTDFIPKYHDDLFRDYRPQPSDKVIALAGLASVLSDRDEGFLYNLADANSPWNINDAFHVNAAPTTATSFGLRFGDTDLEYRVDQNGGNTTLHLPSGESVAVSGHLDGKELTADIGNHRLTATVVRDGDNLHLIHQSEEYEFANVVPAYASKDSGAAAGSLLAPMPGKVVKVAVEAGAAVEEGDLLMTIEAMKMEHAIRAPRAGVVSSVNYDLGALVDMDAVLVAFEANDEQGGRRAAD